MFVYESFNIFLTAPWLILVPVGLFAYLYRRTSTKMIAIAAFFWFAYFIWEILIWSGAACDDGCNIRVDLLGIVPILLILSFAALWSAYKTSMENRSK